MHITKQKKTHRYIEQTRGDQWGEGRREGQNRDKGRGLKDTNYYV